MIKKIKECKLCDLCINQKPLIDNSMCGDVMWVGLSAKRINNVNCGIPLDNDTNSGKLINEIIEASNIKKTYKTNMVKCLPLNDEGKLRYPTKVEMYKCFENLLLEIEEVNPKLIFILGAKVKEVIEKKLPIKLIKGQNYNYNKVFYNDIYYVYVEHPSYICVYKKKDRGKYINSIKEIIDSVI